MRDETRLASPNTQNLTPITSWRLPAVTTRHRQTRYHWPALWRPGPMLTWAHGNLATTRPFNTSRRNSLMATDTRMTIDQEMYERMAGSASLYEKAKETFPSGVTHDARYAKPFPIYVNRALGSRKWDVDGNEYVDYYGGHGALLLGHCHPVVTQAVVEQAQKGSHYGAC